ncbi:Regulatory protein recX [Actinomyces bovis]|uniref:Regulatory protein RecX n=1 Tax=Actinomyces bovis TaxID=1658 RepID=A0ABY1VP48_9ACTO|nr:regulatory protein RecX [Actinomyces bovis]SPT53895.1 Regulatory protein recX [Actinomyces bovis]VEG53336.1 Regulatory protein recX [Actinomyces israelii]
MPWLQADEHTKELEQARDLVLRRLDRSPAPRAALAQLLSVKGVDERIAQEVLDRLETAGVIDDAAYAAVLARTRFAEKGAARRAVAQELRRKGLAEQHIRAALEQIDDSDEAQAALALARKKLRTTSSLDLLVRERRTLALLGRKGYPADVAAQALDQALREEG